MFLINQGPNRFSKFRPLTDCHTNPLKVNNFENKQFQIRHNEIQTTFSSV